MLQAMGELRTGFRRSLTVPHAASKREGGTPASASGKGRPRGVSESSQAAPDSKSPSISGSGEGAAAPMYVIESPEKTSKPSVKSAYRRTGMTDEEWRSRREQEKREDEERARRLARLDLRTPDPERLPTVALVDAYNIMNMDPSIQSFMQSSGDLFTFARAEFERRVQLYAEVSGSHCIVVYDGMGQGHSRAQPDSEIELDSRVSMVFTSRSEADSYIVQKAARLKQAGHTRVEVVSYDRRIETECVDFEDFAIYMMDAASFVKDLQDCASGNTDDIRARAPSPKHNKAALVERMRQEGAAALEQQQQVRLPDVADPHVDQELQHELQRIYDSSSDEEEDVHSRPLAWRSYVVEDKMLAKQDVQKDEIPSDLSADLNDLFSQPKRQTRRRRS